MEGPIFAGLQDQRQSSFQIVEDVARGDAESFKANAGEHAIANLIALRAIAHRVRFTIDFDR